MPPRRFPVAPPLLALLALAVPALGQTPHLADRHAMLPVDDDPTEVICLADLDADGDLDIVFGNGETQNRLCLNDGLGAFLDMTANLPSFDDPTDAVVAEDFDQDGDLDLYIGNGFLGWPDRLYLGSTGAVFTDVTATHLPFDMDGTEDVLAGDFDGDGDLDVMLANDGETAGQQDRIYFNDGAAAFVDLTATNMPIDADKTEGLALADFDLDGDLDAAFANDASQNRLYLGDGLGVFTDATINLPADAATDSEAIAVEDFDQDGDVDILIANSFGPDNQNRLYLNDGLAQFSDGTPLFLPFDNDDSEGLAVGDVDADGDRDVLVVNFFQEDEIYLNDGNGVFTYAPESALPAYFPGSTKASFGDVDGDLDLDIVMAFNRTENRLYLGDGLGQFREPRTHFPTAYLATRAALLADFDGDSDLDAMLADSSVPNSLYLNNGAGALTAAPEKMPTLALPSFALASGDLDGDGDLDVAVGMGGPDALLLNDGTAAFSGVVFPGSPELTTGVALGDVDGDGDLDALTATVVQNHLLLNDGAAGFSDVTSSLPAATAESRAVALLDADGDGDLDVLFGNGLSFGAANFLYLGDGLGAFTDGSSGLPADADETGALAVGDVDLDGDLDFVAGNGAVAGAQDRLYLGDGLGTFTEAAGALPVEDDETCALLLGDLDEDGDLDLVAGNGFFTPEADRLSWNDSLGVFTEDPEAMPAREQLTPALALGDLDGDLDLDVLVGERLAQARVLLNTKRQTSWRGEPRVGKPLTFDLCGPAGELWFLAYSIGTSSLSLPPYGTLYLNPMSLVVVTSGVFDSFGAASPALPIPDNPILVGLDLPWQAVAGTQLRLSNLERSVFTDL